MKQLFIICALVLCQLAATGQPMLPKVMVIPYSPAGQDLRTALDKDVNLRIAVGSVKEGFDSRGFPTVDFLGRLKAARDNRVFESGTQADVKSRIIEMAGCDIYVTVEADVHRDNTGASANVILSAYDAATGNSVANKVGSSGKFYTHDYGKLTAKAVSNCVGEFVAMTRRYVAEMEKDGMPLFVDFTLARGSGVDMTTPMAKYNNVKLSEVLENWLSRNALNGAYHIQGVTSLRLIADDVRIPPVKRNGHAYTPNEFAVELCKFIETMDLSASKDIKAGTIYITIN